MRKLSLIIMYLSLLLLTTGCIADITKSQGGGITEVSGNPTPKDFLDNEEADIFVLDSIVYSNAHNVDWVQELAYTVGEQVTEITRQTDEAQNFKSGTSNKLPVGTKIYKTASGFYIAIVEGEEIPYLAMIEG